MADKHYEFLRKRYEDVKARIEAQKLKRINEYADKMDREEAEEKESQDRRLSLRVEAEKKAFGRPLTPDERLRLEKAREERNAETKERIQRIKKGVHSAVDKSRRMGAVADDVLDDQFQKVPDYGLGPGVDIADKPKVDPVAAMYGVGARRGGKDPLVDMYALRSPELQRSRGFRKGVDVADVAPSGLADFGPLFKKPKGKKKSGKNLYDDLLWKG